MAKPAVHSYLALIVGPYRLAMVTVHVRAVLEEVDCADPPPIAGARWPGLDWAPLLGLGPRGRAPLGVAVDAGGVGAIVGVDAADHLGTAPALLAAPVPTFGLRRPELFCGALRDRRGLLLLLEPTAVIEFIREQRRAV